MQKYYPLAPKFFSLYFVILGKNKHFRQIFQKKILPESGTCSFRSPRRSHSSLPAVKRCDKNRTVPLYGDGFPLDINTKILITEATMFKISPTLA